jgi:hypothetical protein
LYFLCFSFVFLKKGESKNKKKEEGKNFKFKKKIERKKGLKNK